MTLQASMELTPETTLITSALSIETILGVFASTAYGETLNQIFEIIKVQDEEKVYNYVYTLKVHFTHMIF